MYCIYLCLYYIFVYILYTVEYILYTGWVSIVYSYVCILYTVVYVYCIQLCTCIVYSCSYMSHIAVGGDWVDVRRPGCRYDEWWLRVLHVRCVAVARSRSAVDQLQHDQREHYAPNAGVLFTEAGSIVKLRSLLSWN